MIHPRLFSVLALPLVLSVPVPAQETPVANIDRAAEAFVANRFRKFDKDGDGKLTAEEAKPVEFFVSGSDANNDGVYTLEEVQSHLRKQSEALRQQTAQNAPGRSIVGLIAPEIAERFKQLDKNGDGKLIGEELAQARWLSRLDANGDGVTLEEATGFFSRLVEQEPPPKEGEVLPPYVPDETSPRQAPRQIKPAEAGIGRMIPDATFTDLEGKQRRLSEFTKSKATVIALVSSSCPVSKRFLPTLGVLEPEAKKAGVGILLIASIANDTPAQLRAALKGVNLSSTCAPDPNGKLCQMLGAVASTDVFVLDARRTIAYHGALDDQYGLGYSLDAPRQRYAVDAVKAVIEGRMPAIRATEAPGCVLDFAKTQTTSADGVTYHNRISRLLQANCVECHRQGGVAPFGLETYEQVTGKAGMIRRMVERGLMPPWFAGKPDNGAHSPWSNDRSLAERDRAELLAWLASGRPLGDPADAPLPRKWPADWQIGTPDTIYQIGQPIDVKASGTMPYQNVSVETGLTEDKWVTAIEVQPTAREVVHHVLIFVRDPASRARNDATPRIRNEDDGTGGFFAAYVPGNNYVIYPDDFAKPLPAGSRLHFQIHYTPNGTATKDQVRIGLKFAKREPKYVVQVAGIANVRLNIPPGANNHAVAGSIPVPREVKILGFMPHMHVRGKAFRYDVMLPDGSARRLLDVPRYDFNWQLAYRYSEPITIPAGSKIRATGWFDNSADNPANPDPTKTVRWGPQTSDEMMLGYVEYYYPTRDPKVAVK
jgi:peroxiredoxin